MFRNTLILGLLLLGLPVLLAGCHDTVDAQQLAPEPNSAEDTLESDATARRDESVESALAANAETERQQEERRGDLGLTEEAVAAVDETRRAVAAIEDEDHAAAMAALERSLGKLEILLARQPELSLVSVDASTEIVNPVIDSDRIETLRNQVQELIDEGDYQAARLALETMASEIRVTTMNVPLATYPAAIRKAPFFIIETG